MKMETEIRLENGAVCANGLGLPETVYGLEALLQRAKNRLNAVRGGFLYDLSLGSRIPQTALSGRHAAEQALGFAKEALKDCPQIEVLRAQVGENTVTLLLKTPLGEGSVDVHREEIV